MLLSHASQRVPHRRLTRSWAFPQAGQKVPKPLSEAFPQEGHCNSGKLKNSANDNATRKIPGMATHFIRKSGNRSEIADKEKPAIPLNTNFKSLR